jgi:ABC-type transport system involved in multi-copper enzyme maturation permease subunit
MATATKAVKTISFGSLMAAIFLFHLRDGWKSRKTLLLAVVMLLPVAGGVLYLTGEGTNGVGFYKEMVEHVIFAFLLPLVCLFQGGPAVVEEIEGRTITYLFLRPVSKPAIFLGKYLSATIISVVLVTVPTALMFAVCYAAGDPPDNAFQVLAQTSMSVIVGCLSYNAIFAALGAVFGWSLLAGIMFWAGGDYLLSSAPILEFATQNYHLRNASSLVDTKPGPLDRMVGLEQAIDIPLWASYSALFAFVILVLFVGSWVFNQRQYLM